MARESQRGERAAGAALPSHSYPAHRANEDDVLIDEIDPAHILNAPPDLTPELASARWKEINILLHSVALLGDEMEGHKPLLPVLRAAATLASCDRALLFLWDEAVGGGEIVTGVLGRVELYGGGAHSRHLSSDLQDVSPDYPGD